MAAVPTIGRADRAAAQPASPDAHAELLYERLYDRVYGYCLYHLGSREEAEDAAQMTFFQALRGLRRGIVPRFETGWVFAIAKNVCLERHQSRGRRRAREVLLDPATLDCASVDEERQSEDVERLREALTRIPEHQREAVLLREWRGLSYREIAAEMGLSLSAVETLIFRARRSLAQHLTEEPETKRTRLAHGFALGPLAAALKSAVAGSGVKIAVTAAALAAVAALTGGALVGSDGPADTPRRPTVVAPSDVPPGVEPAFLRPAVASHPTADPSPAPARVGTRSAPEPEGPTDSSQLAAPVGAIVEQTDGVVQESGEVLDQTADVLEPVLQPLEPIVQPVESSLEPVLQAAPELSELPLPELQLP